MCRYQLCCRDSSRSYPSSIGASSWPHKLARRIGVIGVRGSRRWNRDLNESDRIGQMNTGFQFVGQSESSFKKDILRVQVITLLWMSAEAGISIWTAMHAHSVALLGFGADSGIELLS